MSSGDSAPFAEVANCYAVLPEVLFAAVTVDSCDWARCRVERAGLVEEARFVGLASFHFVFIKMMWDRPVGYRPVGSSR